ncbi:hypothetical protein D3C84_1208170 [compost metagenome]
MSLEDDEDRDDRNDHEGGAGHLEGEVASVLSFEQGQANGQGIQLLVVGDDERPDKAVPAGDKGKDALYH